MAEPIPADQTSVKSPGKWRQFLSSVLLQSPTFGASERQLLFQSLLLDYYAISPKPPAASELVKTAESLIATSGKRRLSWLELYDFEALLIRLRGEDDIRRAVWGLRQEFQLLATTELWERYAASKPPDPGNPAVEIRLVRSDVEDLMRQLHELRLGKSLLDVIRAYSTILTMAVCIALTGLTLFYVYHTRHGLQHYTPMLVLAAFAGASGAGFSMLNRLSEIPSKGDLISRYPGSARVIVWISTPLLSLMEGVFGAIVLYFLFRAQFVTGTLFPQFVENATPTAAPLVDLLIATVPSALVGAKLIIWSFLAGFSERLVPDMLTRLTQQAEKMNTPQPTKLPTSPVGDQGAKNTE